MSKKSVEKNKYITSRFFVLLVSTLVAILFLAAEAFEFRSQREEVWSVFIAFGIFVLGERLTSISDYLADEEIEQTRASNFRELEKLFSSKIELRKIGTPSEGMQWLIGALNGEAVHVRDTICRVNANVSYPSEVTYRDFDEALESFLNRSGRYIIVGNPNGYTAHLPPRKLLERPNLFVKTKDFTFPIINSVIITYINNKKEVLFGWDYDRAHVSNVFLSEDTSLVAHFEGLFASALENSDPFADTRPASDDGKKLDADRML